MKTFSKTVIAALALSVIAGTASADTRVCTSLAEWNSGNKEWVTTDTDLSMIMAVSEKLVTVINTQDDHSEVSYGFSHVDKEGDRVYKTLRGAEIAMYKDQAHAFIYNANGAYLLQDCTKYE